MWLNVHFHQAGTPAHCKWCGAWLQQWAWKGNNGFAYCDETCEERYGEDATIDKRARVS